MLQSWKKHVIFIRWSGPSLSQWGPSLFDIVDFYMCPYLFNVRYVMEFLAWWVLKSKVFTQKSTVVKWNCCILWIDIAWGLQKLGLILESKVVQKLSLEKNVFNKKWSPKLIFLDEIFFWKNSVDFWHRKLTLKVQFWHFLRPWHYVNLQNTAISFEYSWFLSKNLAF